MARRTFEFNVAIAVDEDTMRLHEDDHPTAWPELTGSLVMALNTIVMDNLDALDLPTLDAEVHTTSGHRGIIYNPSAR